MTKQNIGRKCVNTDEDERQAACIDITEAEYRHIIIAREYGKITLDLYI